MQIDPPETSQLQAFIAIADAGSISGGAVELALPRATVSRRLQRLEEQLGVRLVQRSTRALRLTDAGELFYGQARAIVLAVEAASLVVRADAGRPSGLLRISVPPMSEPAFRAMLLAFMEAYPDVELEVSSSTRYEDLVNGNIDLAWRAGVDIDSALVARRLLLTELVAVAAPAYLQRAGRPMTLSELDRHDCLLGFARGERPTTHWPLRDGGTVRVRGKLVSNELALLLDAVRRGLGIALVPEHLVSAEVARGALEPVLQGVVGTTSHVALVYTERRLMKPAVRAFVDFVVAWIQEQGLWVPAES